MLPPKGNADRKDGGGGLVAVAIDRDKNSQNALKWAIDHLLQRGQTVVLIHVKVRQTSAFSPSPSAKLTSMSDPGENHSLICHDPDPITRDLFLPFRCFCTRKDIQCKDVVLEETDVTRALVEYTSRMAIENLVLGAASKSGFLRFRTVDIPSSVLKSAPDFCTVTVISKGKIAHSRTATRAAPASSPLRQQLQYSSARSAISDSQVALTQRSRERPPTEPSRKSTDESEFFRSPFTRKGLNGKSYGEIPMPDTDISFVSSGRSSIDKMFPSFYDSESRSPKMSSISDMDMHSFESSQWGRKSLDMGSPTDIPGLYESGRLSASQLPHDDVDAEMRRLRLELKQTMELYSSACKEALTAKQKALELQRWKLDEEERVKKSHVGEEAIMAAVEEEKAKYRAAHADAADRIAELEAQKKRNAEKKALKEEEEKKKAAEVISDVRYRKYSIEEIETATQYFADNLKIGEGGYGPVYKSYLDHTPVAIKVLRPDAAQGRSQFNQEVEVLSCIRHPNMVLLLGACPEYGCLVYEFMANGSLEDRLFRRGNTPPLPWQLRFKIAAEIGTGLLFLHNTKPEPLVHRDLKPANILLDRNFVSKISDVGLARLVPPSVADTVTQYRMTSTAGTFCYIDPEYQQTGMLGVKSDIYSLGIIFLQLLTARPPMGLSHHVERAIEKNTLREMLDPTVPDWPYEEALALAKLSLRCSELRRKDRPNLGKIVLPELDRLRTLAEESLYPMMFRANPVGLPVSS